MPHKPCYDSTRKRPSLAEGSKTGPTNPAIYPTGEKPKHDTAVVEPSSHNPRILLVRPHAAMGKVAVMLRNWNSTAQHQN